MDFDLFLLEKENMIEQLDTNFLFSKKSNPTQRVLKLTNKL